jgi:hypothetical protein
VAIYVFEVDCWDSPLTVTDTYLWELKFSCKSLFLNHENKIFYELTRRIGTLDPLQ